ncbi:glycosyltransferase [Egbenema bharatensis]|uniref:glycosyltransferase n=1 Tax=Egbenema bharatensis TaxID=3463334 RepID=UPI003A84B3E1
MILLVLLALSLTGAAIFTFRLWNSLRQTPFLQPNPPSPTPVPFPTTAIIIPAYNEAENIEECVTSVLESTVAADCLQVWVVDDQSTDDTATIVQLLQSTRNDPRLHLLMGQPRPDGEIWVGKSWPVCRELRKSGVIFCCSLMPMFGWNQGRSKRLSVPQSEKRLTC